jgi:hypothetical protein
MAHYAYLDENNIVIDVIVGKDETELINGLDTETYYGAVRTSYNAATNGFRKNYAGIGYLYDAIRDAFIPPKPDCHPDLISLDEQTCQWLCTGIHLKP